MQMSVFVNDVIKPKMVADVEITSTLMETSDFKFFGVSGTAAFWEIQSNESEFYYLVLNCLLSDTTHHVDIDSSLRILKRKRLLIELKDFNTTF